MSERIRQQALDFERGRANGSCELEVLANACDALASRKYVQLGYDIEEGSGVSNPSALLWWHGFRHLKSSWILPEEALGHPDIKELLAYWSTRKVTCDILPYAEEGVAQIRRLARRALETEMARQHAALIASIEAADKELEKAQAASSDAAGRLAADRDREQRVREAIKRAQESFAAVLQCAQTYDETEEVRDLLAAQRHLVECRREAFNARAEAELRPVLFHATAEV